VISIPTCSPAPAPFMGRTLTERAAADTRQLSGIWCFSRATYAAGPFPWRRVTSWASSIREVRPSLDKALET
jgi:hypothetical protein